jgi:hypothetical protein
MSGPNPSAEPELSKEGLLLDGLRRLKGHSPVYLLNRLVLTQQLWMQLSAARRRVNDSHNYYQRVLGEPVSEDDAGNISLKGDTTTTNHITYNGSRWLPWILGAAAVAGTAWWMSQPSKPTAEPPLTNATPWAPPLVIEEPVTEQPRDDWRLGVTVSDTP